jgi:hypothetical protein
MKSVMIALVVLVAGPAVASERFPAEGEAWRYEGRTPVAGGVARFLRLEATPAPRSGWAVTMTCGTVSVADGREVVSYRGTGSAARDRRGTLGGTTVSPGKPTAGWGIVQRGDGLLDQVVETAAPGEDTVCPNARGDFSTGD